MKNKIIMLMFVSLILLASLNFVKSEIYMWNSVSTDKPNQMVNFHGYYQLEDTTAEMSGINAEVSVFLWYIVEPLPLNLSIYGQVDYCNFTIHHYKNEFDNLGNIINTSDIITEYSFMNSPLNSTLTIITAKNKDSITADMKCHYTDINGLYYGNILAGRFVTYTSSYQCNFCGDYSLEELSNLAQMNENLTANELTIYDRIQTFVDWNFMFWLILSWVIKIGLVLLAIGLIFAGGYYFYIFINNLGKDL